MINIPTEVLIANAFYAIQENRLEYDELKEYKIAIYQTLTKKYKYIMFNDKDNILTYHNRVSDTKFNINGRLFIKLNDGIQLFSNDELNEEWINKVNSSYSSDEKKLIEESWQKYNKVKRQVQKQKIIK